VPIDWKAKYARNPPFSEFYGIVLATFNPCIRRIGYPQSASSFVTCIEHRYVVVLFGFSGPGATFSLMWSRDLCDWLVILLFYLSSEIALTGLYFLCIIYYIAFAVMLRLSINWKSIHKTCFYFLVQYTPVFVSISTSCSNLSIF
jgi:hypothetical protein